MSGWSSAAALIVAGALIAVLLPVSGSAPTEETDVRNRLSATATTLDGPGANESIEFVSPANNSMWNTSSLEFGVLVKNFTLDPAKIGNQTNEPGRGHYHVYVNGSYSRASGYPTFNLTRLTPGMWGIEVRLSDHNHSELSPPVSADLTIVVVAGAPWLRLLSPLPDETVNGSSLQGAMGLANFTLDPKSIGNSTNKNGTGHVHVLLDGKYELATGYPGFNLTKLKAGAHRLRVELHNNNHSSLSPEVFDQVAITVLAMSPSLAILSPGNGAVVNSSSILFKLEVMYFKLNGSAIGLPSRPGEGHYHVELDGAYLKAAADPGFDLTNISAGAHAVRVELRNNDHTDLVDPVWHTISIEVRAARPGLTILKPKDGSAVNSSTVVINVKVENFRLNGSAIGKPNRTGEGHLHLLLDGAYVKAAAATSLDLRNLSSGAHVVRVELHNNDHTDLVEPVWDEARVAINGSRPGIVILSPATGTKLATHDATLEVDVTNFRLNASAVGGANKVGEGHYHVFVDEAYVAFGASPTAMIKLPNGRHVVKVELRNNDHSALADPPFDWIDLEVAAPLPTIAITDPAEGADVSARDVTVQHAVANFVLNGSAMGKPAVPGEGHVHVFVDGNYTGPTAATNVTVTNLSAGAHVVRIQLFNNDHTAVDPHVWDEVNFTVNLTKPAETPAIKIAKPANGTTLVGEEVELEFEVEHFVLVKPVSGMAIEEGKGHIHLFIDGSTDPLIVWEPRHEVTKLEHGEHRFKAILVNHDHSPVAGAKAAEITVHLEEEKETPVNFVPVLAIGFTSLILILIWALYAWFKLAPPAKRSADQDEEGAAAEGEAKDAEKGAEKAPSEKS